MKQTKLHKFTSKKTILLASIVVLLLVLIVLEKTHTTDFIHLPSGSNTSKNGPTPEQKKQEAQANADAKQKFIEEPQQNPTSTTSSSSTNISLTASQNGENVTVYTKLSGYGSGTCRLETTNLTKSNIQTADVVYQPEYSSCAGFNIPIANLGIGKWNIKLIVSENGSSKDSTIQLEVK